jgi:hypothetical protein
VAACGYNLEDDQIIDLRAAGIQVFQHGLCPAVFAAIANQSSEGPSDGELRVQHPSDGLTLIRAL